MAEEVTARKSRVVSFVWLVLFVGVGAFFSVLLTQAMKDRQRHEVKRVRVARSYDDKREQLAQLALERDAIKSDPVCVEGVARGSLNYAKPGEVSYRRESVKLRKVRGNEKTDKASPLAALVETKLAHWQVPITVLAVIIIALLIVRGFRPKEEGPDLEGAP